jgi:hypothetical protein
MRLFIVVDVLGTMADVKALLPINLMQKYRS